jgi:hypothetical protein
MPLVDDTRGVTVQVGAVLLLGLVVISLSLYQVQVVPSQNAQVEFDHSQQVQSDVQELRNALQRTAATGSGQPTTVALGTRYPARVVAVNPPPASGSLRTEPAGSVAVANATALDPDADDFWNGTTHAYPTKRLVYAPDYATYDNPPTTVVEGGVVYNRFDGGQTVTLTDAGLVEGRTVSFVTVEGRLSTSRTDAVSVDPVPVSTTRRTVTVVADDGPVTLSLQTGLSQAQWRDLLADEYVRNGGHVAGNESGVVVTGDTLTVTLEQGVAYDLRLGAVGVGTDTGSVDPAYLVESDAPDAVPPRETREVTVEVRDRYDNPVSGVTVAASADRGHVAESSVVTDEAGRATMTYTAPASGGRDTIRTSYRGVGAGFDAEDPADVATTVRVTPPGTVAPTSVRTVISTSFEGEGTALADYGWTGSGSDERVRPFDVGSGTQAAALGGSDAPNVVTSPRVDTTGGGYLDVEFDAFDRGPEAGRDEDLIVEYYGADDTWHEVTTVEAQSPREDLNFSRRHLVTDATAFHDAFRLRFRQPSATGTDRWYVDDVRVFVVGTGTGGGGPGSGGGVGGASLNAPDVTDLSKVTGNDGLRRQSQTVSFTLGGRLAEGETVTVDLGEAQADRVDYGDATASVGAGTANIDTTGTAATLTYTAPEGGANGRVTIDLDDVAVANGNGGPYTVTFTRNDSDDSTTTTFRIL